MIKDEIEVSVVIPCLNEEGTIGDCVNKIKGFFSRNNINGEVVVVDNGSSDKSAEIAAALGARVISEPVRGYGSAYLRGFKESKGLYIIMGDADNTYDFSDLKKFIDPLKQGYELVMGSRFKGKIYKGAMPWLNRYFGNPALSGLCRLFFNTNLSDIHCGMRSFTKSAYQKMNLRCLGMEFATEMVMESLQRNLKIFEVPIDYYARGGHSKLRPLKDGWRHLRFMLLFCPTWLYFIPGALIGGAGFLAMILLSFGPVEFLGHAWDIHALILSSFFSILGYQLIFLGLSARTFAVKENYLTADDTISFLSRHFKLETGIVLGLILVFFGFGINFSILIEWWHRSFGALYRIRESVVAMTLMILGLQTIFSSFFLSLLVIRR